MSAESLAVVASVDALKWDLLPQHPGCRDGLRAHILQGRPVGDFLTAVLGNDFLAAVVRADAVNLPSLRGYAHFLHNEAPGACYGSPEKVKAWRRRGGLLGQTEKGTT